MKSAQFALLFDLDGTLADSDPLHYRAFARLLEENGKTLTPELYQRHVVGGFNAGIMRALFPELSAERRQQMADHKEALFRASVGEMEPIAGARRLFDWAAAQGAAIAVVTNAPRANAELMLDKLALRSRVDALIVGDELEHAKPHPLPYLTALKRLGASAGRACAFEDSPSGIRAARAAGVHTFGIASDLDPACLAEAGAAGVLADFHAPALWEWLERQTASV
nr:HAD-IA family hydrolase [Chromobacterium sp. ASV5]